MSKESLIFAERAVVNCQLFCPLKIIGWRDESMTDEVVDDWKNFPRNKSMAIDSNVTQFGLAPKGSTGRITTQRFMISWRVQL